MSFVDSFYNSFSIVKKNTGKSNRSVEDIIRFFRLKIEVDEDYMKGLEKLANYTVMLRDGTILNAVNALKNNSYSKAFQVKTLIDSIKADIIIPLSNLLKTQSDIIKPYNTEAIKIQTLKDSLIEKVATSKKKYWKSCQECEKTTFSLEEALAQNVREKLLNRLTVEKELLDRNAADYYDSIDKYKLFKDSVKDKMIPILNLYEIQEKERLDSIKDALRKLVVYDTSMIRNIQYDLDTLAHYMESINTISDLKFMIDESLGQSEFPNIEFEAYTSEHSAPTTSTEASHVSELQSIYNKVFENQELTPEDFLMFNTLIKDPIGRKAWASLFEKTPSLIQNNFELLGELMISLLNECERAVDVNVIKECLKYSGYFYNESGNKLSKITKVHSIWSKFEIWELVINKSIKDEINNRQVCKIFSNAQEQDEAIKNIAFCQLGYIAGLMNELNVEFVYAAEILSKNACKYNLSAEDIDTLMASANPSLKVNGRDVAPSVQRGIPQWLTKLSTPPKKAQPKSLTELLNNN